MLPVWTMRNLDYPARYDPWMLLVVCKHRQLIKIIYRIYFSTSKIYKKNGKFANIQIFIAKSSYKACRKIAQIATNHSILKSSWSSGFNSSKICETWMCSQWKLKMCKFPLKASVQNFFANIVQSAYFSYRFQKSCTMLKSNFWKLALI